MAAVVSTASVSALAGAGSASDGPGRPGPGRLSTAERLVNERQAALARMRAKVTALGAALTGLQIQVEVLTERYDQAMSLAQQAAAAYQVASARLAVARQAEAVERRRLVQQAVADYEAGGPPSLGGALLAGGVGPAGYFAAAGLQQAMAAERVDTLAAGQADAIVTRLFRRQAAALLAAQRAAAQAADFLRRAVQAAVRRQAGVVKLASASRSSAAAALASARASLAILAAEVRSADGDADGDEAGGVTGALPTAASMAAEAAAAAAAGAAASGGTAPAWAPGAGASVVQGEIAAHWALSQLGKPYRWGGAGPDSYDCSGLVMDAWARAGVPLAHWTGFQWTAGPHLPVGRLRPGDLVFYATDIADPGTIHHVGIYIGNDLMVDAPFTGAVVRIDNIYQWPGLIGATRPAI
jgi:cell wall-associated NlpC family hydrolase